MQGIGAKKSQEEARAELRRYNKEISSYSKHLVAAKKVLTAAHTIWTTTGQNLCFLTAARVLLATAQKHEDDTPECLETLTKRGNKATFG